MRSQTKQIMQIVIKAFVGSSVTECAHRVSEKADFTALPLRAGGGHSRRNPDRSYRYCLRLRENISGYKS